MMQTAALLIAAMAAVASAQEMCEGSPMQQCRQMCAPISCTANQCAMRSGNCCDVTCQDIAGAGSSTGATNDCPDIDGDGDITVTDVLSVLSHFNSADTATDLDNNGNVDVNDVLTTLGMFGDPCPSAEPAPYMPGPVIGGMGGGGGHPGGGGAGTGFNCCGGGTACGYQHCAALGAGQDGCVQPWGMPAGMTMDQCDSATVTAPTEPGQVACPANKVWNDCASSCSQTCGADMPMMCNEMCNQQCDCPRDLPVWDGSAYMGRGTCVASQRMCTMNNVPPGVAIGRPFMKDNSVPVTASLVAGEW